MRRSRVRVVSLLAALVGLSASLLVAAPAQAAQPITQPARVVTDSPYITFTGSPEYATGAMLLDLRVSSGLAPGCASPASVLCVAEESERVADLKYVASTHQSGQAHVAVATRAPWEFLGDDFTLMVLIDTDRDSKPDY